MHPLWGGGKVSIKTTIIGLTNEINVLKMSLHPSPLSRDRIIELENELERLQKLLRWRFEVGTSIENEIQKADNNVAAEADDASVEDDQSDVNSTASDISDKGKPYISSDRVHTEKSDDDDDDDGDYGTELLNMTEDNFMKEVNRRRKVREAKVNNAESIDTNNNDSTENSFNIDNDNNTASTSDIVDKHDTVNDNENNPPSTANRLAGETRNVRASTRGGVSRPHYSEPSLKSKLRREDVENASSACNVPQPIPQSISTRGSRIGRKARSTTTCYKEPSSKTKLRREP